MELDTNSVGSGRKERINGGMVKELKGGEGLLELDRETGIVLGTGDIMVY